MVEEGKNTDLEQETKDSKPGPKHKKTEGPSKAIGEVIRFIAIAAILVIVVREFVVQPFIVKGDSMVPNFESGEYLIIDELTYRFRDIDRGEVIVFRYPKDPKQFFIKRIIGLPGESVTVRDNKVTIKKTSGDQGTILEETYLLGSTLRNTSVTLGDDEYFVMGDNREASSDSRSWGALPESFIVGRALLRVLPISKADFLPGDFSNEFLN